MRIYLNANVLFSAAKSDGAVRELLRSLDRAGHECWVDGYVIAEARRNLAAKYPGSMVDLDKLLTRMTAQAVQPRDPTLEGSLPLPAKGRPVLAAAIRLRCNALVTCDRTHFGALYGRTIHGVTIHSPRSLAEALLR